MSFNQLLKEAGSSQEGWHAWLKKLKEKIGSVLKSSLLRDLVTALFRKIEDSSAVDGAAFLQLIADEIDHPDLSDEVDHQDLSRAETTSALLGSCTDALRWACEKLQGAKQDRLAQAMCAAFFAPDSPGRVHQRRPDQHTAEGAGAEEPSGAPGTEGGAL